MPYQGGKGDGGLTLSPQVCGLMFLSIVLVSQITTCYKWLQGNIKRNVMINMQRYRFVCTLTFGDVYGQIIVWLIVIFLSLASAMALMGASRPIYALATVGLILVLSLPFLLFAFVTTLLNHIELREINPAEKMQPATAMSAQQKAAQAIG